MPTQSEIALQMVQQLRVLDPSVSAEVGSPERKIIDTVAQALADTQIDVSTLGGLFDLDTKFGSDLDSFFGLFGYARQKGSAAVGVVEFGRNIAASTDILIPAGTLLASSTVPDLGFAQQIRALFVTTQAVTLEAGQLVVSAPVRATTVGAFTNVAADTITVFVASPVIGITEVTNPVATRGGLDAESDDEAKVRFKNTVFRNLAGTEDQFLALAVTGAFTNKANVVGAISRYREYIQIPAVDDATAYDIDGDGISEPGNGDAGEYTTALSTIPYAKYTYGRIPTLVSNGNTGVDAIFYTEGLDFRLNTSATNKNKGDAYRSAVAISPIDADPTEEDARPNFTFFSVYDGADIDVEAPRAGDALLAEHSYISSASRNDIERNLLNAVDVYVNGINEIAATTVIPRPETLQNLFVDQPTNRLHFENYRRIGEPEHRPVLGNVFSSLFWNPLVSLPESISLQDNTYIRGVHYWPIYDVGPQGRSVRARTGIEWSIDLPGQTTGDPAEGPYSGDKITAVPETSIEIIDYTYNRNIPELQIVLEAQKQVTTDVLAHEATQRYLKFDITVMYVAGSSSDAVNQSVFNNLSSFLKSQFFGSAIQLSDILQVVHNTPGIDNVRWSADVNPRLHRVTETDVGGDPLLGGISDRTTVGDGSTKEVQQFYLTGDPTGGTYTLKLGAEETGAIPYDAVATQVESAILADITEPIDSLEGDGTVASPFIITFTDTQFQIDLFEVNGTNLESDTVTFNSDFFMRDDELPALPSDTVSGDSLPGLIIRERAQSTWNRA